MEYVYTWIGNTFILFKKLTGGRQETIWPNLEIPWKSPKNALNLKGRDIKIRHGRVTCNIRP